MPKVNGCLICKHLRSKEMYYEENPLARSVEETQHRIFWCQKTFDAIGPGAVDVNRVECQPGRTCFEA